MSDIVVVMSTAQVRQIGPPLEIYRSPANAFVADFIGTSNLIEAHAAGVLKVAINGDSFDVPALPEGVADGEALMVSIRPEDVHVLPADSQGPNRLAGKVTFVRDVGASVETFVDCGGVTVISISAPKDRPDVRQGDAAMVELPSVSCVVVRK